MDIGKYIGLCLLKNKYVYVHGLGNLVLRKKAAGFADDAIQPTTFEVVMTTTGSIDDNLANYIATNEQTSISKAANEIRDFSVLSPCSAAGWQGRDHISSIGKFTMVNDKIAFLTDPHLAYTPPSMPVLRIDPRDDEKAVSFEQQPVSTSGSVSWRKVVIFAGVLLLLGLAAYVGYKYMNRPASTNESTPPE